MRERERERESVSLLRYGYTTWMPTKHIKKKYKNAASCNEQILEVTSHKAAAIWPPPSNL